MAKYHGNIGFVTFPEVTPGVNDQEVSEREYFGDVLRNSKRWESSQQVNPDLTINNQISIVADPYARDNLFAIRYACWMGTRWIVTSVDVQYPRLILSIGGVYNGPTPRSTSGSRGTDGSMCGG